MIPLCPKVHSPARKQAHLHTAAFAAPSTSTLFWGVRSPAPELFRFPLPPFKWCSACILSHLTATFSKQPKQRQAPVSSLGSLSLSQADGSAGLSGESDDSRLTDFRHPPNEVAGAGTAEQAAPAAGIRKLLAR